MTGNETIAALGLNPEALHTGPSLELNVLRRLRTIKRT